MPEEQPPKKPGLRAKRRERKRLEQERTGDTPEKREEPSHGVYDARDATIRAGLGGMMGGGGG
ncbi:hypothetical protein C8N24_1675 [Solirubrobacter pauli]|uniref:Uncharacterized protein n=1 Tax=Solirubrobacter pauli TaxID=166793 RepID=A0A660LDA4_9ACTN|nr:hypothetical protein [Solirubrobacter pauli]RKQ91843.1 hypothetical protein C8N24_1675 [Solirubrobacter pauli]